MLRPERRLQIWLCHVLAGSNLHDYRLSSLIKHRMLNVCLPVNPICGTLKNALPVIGPYYVVQMKLLQTMFYFNTCCYYACQSQDFKHAENSVQQIVKNTPIRTSLKEFLSYSC